MITKTEAIKNFLTIKTHADLGSMYSADMECQVNVAQDGGERIDGDFKGRKWQGWTNGVETWKSFRIPYKANSDPEYTDSQIKFDIAEHAEAIGMTGWDWKNRVSKWVAFDFDAIVGHSDKHSQKLTNEQLKEVRDAACAVGWVTIRKSTSGTGLHLYVCLDNVQTENHNEHAALARAVLGKMSAITGFDFISKVDNCGGCMWVWHRKMLGTDGLILIKQGSKLLDIPPNWKDHVKVVSGKSRKTVPQVIEEKDITDPFDQLAGQYPKITLDAGHKKFIDYLTENNAVWWWDQDYHMLVTHTIHLQAAHEDLQLKGYFKTVSRHSSSHNCFMFPLRNGAFAVRRFTPGVQEHESWLQDQGGWTKCYFNREPDLATVCRAYGGLEDPKGGFIFQEAEIAIKAAQLLGIQIQVGTPMMGRNTKLKEHKDGRLIVEVDHDPQDRADVMAGWLPKDKKWLRIFNTPKASTTNDIEVGNYDDMVRHLVTESNEDYGWMIRSDNTWRAEPLTHVKAAMASLGLNTKDVTSIIGSSVFRCWKIVNKPFQPMYPGDREWNMNSAQLRYMPSEYSPDLKYGTWLGILKHCGQGLDVAIHKNPWCKANGILNGADYLKCWIASLFQEPTEPLPYLFLYGPENSGKSILHEALELLLTKGYKRADASLISQAGFNGELEGAILCVVEETDLKKNNVARNRIKDWVTGRELLIHPKGETPYHVKNCCHWIQCNNDYQACPVFPGDTRITMCYVPPLDPFEIIPKKQIIPILEKEAPDFLAEILNLELPPSNDRLNVPVISTEDKETLQQLNQTDLETFLKEKCRSCTGYSIKFGDFYDNLVEWLDPNEVSKWTKIRVGKELPPQYPKGRVHSTGQYYIGNISWVHNKEDTEVKPRMVLKDGYLEVADE